MRDGLNTKASLKEGSHFIPLFSGSEPEMDEKENLKENETQDRRDALLLQVRLHFSGEEEQNRGYPSLPGQGTR